MDEATDTTNAATPSAPAQTPPPTMPSALPTLPPTPSPAPMPEATPLPASPPASEAISEPAPIPLAPEATPEPALTPPLTPDVTPEPTTSDLAPQSTPEPNEPRSEGTLATGATSELPSEQHSHILENVRMSEESQAPQVIEKVVEKIVEKEVVKEVPVERIVEKVVYKDVEPSDGKFKTMLGDFLRSVSKKGRDKQHARAIAKRQAVLALFDTHAHVTQKLVRDTFKLAHTDANRILTALRDEGKITLHEPRAPKDHHGGRGTYYSRGQ